jgi:hypothetical protein
MCPWHMCVNIAWASDTGISIKLCTAHNCSRTFYRDRGFLICNPYPNFVAIAACYQTVTQKDRTDHSGFPTIVRYKKFSLDFKRHRS